MTSKLNHNQRGNGAPIISVVMPVRNGMPYLTEAVSSILQQRFGNFEFLIIDDGSTDETSEYLRSLADPRVRVIRHEVSRGVAESLNHGIELAAAPLVARQDADDVSAPERFEKQMAWLSAHPEGMVLGSQVDKIDVTGKVIEHFPRPMTEPEFRRHFDLCANPFTHGSVIMPREKIVAAGGYRGRIRCAEDYDLWLRLSGSVTLANHPETLYRYRVHQQQICVRQYQEASADCWVSLVMQMERSCTGEEDSLSLLDDRQLAAIRERRLWKPRGAWARRVQVLKHYARLVERDSPRRARLLKLTLLSGGW
jgi:glycosyltransferase involved in cell wall biosynthesis